MKKLIFCNSKLIFCSSFRYIVRNKCKIHALTIIKEKNIGCCSFSRLSPTSSIETPFKSTLSPIKVAARGVIFFLRISDCGRVKPYEMPRLGRVSIYRAVWSRKHESPSRNYIPSLAVTPAVCESRRESCCNKILTISEGIDFSFRHLSKMRMQAAPFLRLKFMHMRARLVHIYTILSLSFSLST